MEACRLRERCAFEQVNCQNRKNGCARLFRRFGVAGVGLDLSAPKLFESARDLLRTGS